MDTVRSKLHFRVSAFDGGDNNQLCIFVCCILVEVISTSIISTHSSFYTTCVAKATRNNISRTSTTSIYYRSLTCADIPKFNCKQLWLTVKMTDSDMISILAAPEVLTTVNTAAIKLLYLHECEQKRPTIHKRRFTRLNQHLSLHQSVSCKSTNVYARKSI